MTPVPDLTDSLAKLDALDRLFAAADHDLWIGDDFNVAPTRIAETKAIRAKGVDQLDDGDLDYVMFKCMTTMGGVATFKFFLPRFIRAVLANPFYGWTSEAHVLMNKLRTAGFEAWSLSERATTADALEVLAQTYILIDESEETGPDPDARALLALARSAKANA